VLTQPNQQDECCACSQRINATRPKTLPSLTAESADKLLSSIKDLRSAMHVNCTLHRMVEASKNSDGVVMCEPLVEAKHKGGFFVCVCVESAGSLPLRSSTAPFVST